MKKPIIVICPMESEYAVLAGLIEDPVTEETGPYLFTRGKIDGYPVIISRCLMGMVNAAIATTVAIKNYDPLCVIDQGTSGAHNRELHQNDIVIGSDVVQIGSTFPGMEVLENGSIVTKSSLSCNGHLVKIAEQTPYAKGKKITGRIGTADIWNRDRKMLMYLRSEFKTECEDMETFAVAQACKQFDIPFSCIRIISNNEFFPEETFGMEFAETCQYFVFDVLKNIVAEIKNGKEI